MLEKVFRRFVSIGTWIFFYINLYYCFIGRINTVPSINGIFMLGTAVVFSVFFYCIFSKECGNKKSSYFFYFYLPIIISGILSLVYYWFATTNILSMIYKTIRPISVVRIYAIGLLVYWLKTRKFSFKKKYLPLIVAFNVTELFYPVIEVLFSNNGWTFNVLSVFLQLFIFVLVSIAIMVLLTAYIEDAKAEKLVAVLAWYVLCSYIQTMLMNGHLFMMDGAEQVWDNKVVFGNIFIWIIIAGAFIIIFKKKNEKFILFVNYLLVLITGMQLVASASLFINGINSNSEQKKQASSYLSSNDLYTVGRERNIIILVLDFYDTDYLNQALVKKTDLLNCFNDFVYYPDTVSQFSRTIPSLTYMLTQHEDFQQTPFDEYVDEAFSGNPLWENISNLGYQYNIYAINNNSFSNEFRKGANNYIENGYVVKARYSLEGLYTSFVNIGHFRGAPYLWKNYYVYTQDEINSNIMAEYELDNPMYCMDDAKFYRDLCDDGLSLDDSDNRITFIHLNGAHPPYTLSGSSQRVSEKESDAVDQYIGSMNIVGKYLEELKKLGVYDNSMIIVTADHGENYMLEELEQNTNPILLIKYPNVKQDELRVSDIPVSQEDMICTVSAQIDASMVLKGYNLYDEDKIPVDRIRYHYYTVVDGSKQLGIVPYKIVGNSQDFSNWQKEDGYIEFKYY